MNEIVLNNGITIPQLGLGVFRVKDGEEAYNAVRYALDAGYRHIDTAAAYKNEESVGRAIRDSGIAREDIFVTTKLWTDDVRAGRAKEAYKESLQKLGMNYVDLYLIHWPAVGYEKAWKDLEDMYLEGQMRAIGVSNFHAHHLADILPTARVIPAMDQVESSPSFTNSELLAHIRSLNIQPEAWSPFGGSLDKNVLKDENLLQLAAKYGKSTAQVVLRWHIQQGNVVIPKSIHKERIEENLQVFDFSLSDEDVALISSFNKDIRAGSNPDTFNF